jgi:endogenous inhibitor of DNA gyrase (YacG/DUF329 family)
VGVEFLGGRFRTEDCPRAPKTKIPKPDSIIMAYHPESGGADSDASEPLRKSQCPTCGKRFLMDETPAPPFCCERCRLIDLGRWLDEGIGLPHEADESPKTIDRELIDGSDDDRRGSEDR